MNKIMYIFSMVCNKCNVEKSIEQFRIEVKNGKEYRKKYCKTCHQQQSRKWKENNPDRLYQRKNPIIVNESQAIPDVKVVDNSLLRYCPVCGLEKPIILFYKNQKHRCKQCQNKYAYQLEIENGDGTRWQVRQKPDDYYNDAQREELFGLMISLGWSYTDGIWWKEQFGKKEDGTFIFKNTNLLPKVKPRGPGGRRRVLFLETLAEEMINYRAQGMAFDEIASIYNTSHTTIRRVIKEYYDKQRQGTS